MVTPEAMTVPVVKDLVQAFTTGTSIRALEADHPRQLMAWLQYEIIRTCQYLECKNTITNDNDALELADELIEQFPTMKIEEFAIVFKNIRLQKYGKYYERLKAGEFIDCFLKHDSSDERIRILEQINTEARKESTFIDPIESVDYDKFKYTPQEGVYQKERFCDSDEVKRKRALAERVLREPMDKPAGTLKKSDDE